MAKILCFGDSITYGAWDSRGGWVARLRERIDKVCIESDLEKFYLTYNLGISSDTSQRLLERFDGELAARMLEDGEPYFVFSIGTNDSIWLNNENHHWVEIEQFKTNIRAVIEKAKHHSQKIVFLGSLPVDEAKTQPYRDDDSIKSSNSAIGAYESATETVCREVGVGFIPEFEKAQLEDTSNLLFNDGVHPNEVGHELLVNLVWGYIQREGWIE